MMTTHAVGIDLGTTYSCIAYLNEQGEPVSIPNREGEISTPSVVMYENGEEVVGTEAWRNSIMHPMLVVQNSKRYMGDPNKVWVINGKSYTPVDVACSILKKLIGDAKQQIGTIERAVITVPAQFSERQRLATVEAGKRAGLKHVDIINEPVAAALCYVLGQEGLWFSALADEQRILVYDLGGGTFDLSLVSYQKDQVKVMASAGDLHLGGIDWNQRLLVAISDQFKREFGVDPRSDPESLQHLSWEVEQCKRSLTVRPRAALIVQHAGKRKTYQIERDQFNSLTADLLRRTQEITQKLVDQHKKGTSRLDVTVLSTGGSSRMPMVDDMLKGIRGTTLNKVLSPDQSIAHGATYYAGMLLTNSEFVHAIQDKKVAARLARMKQQSVNARGLGILIRDVDTDQRVPFYLIPADTALPASAKKIFGTVSANQRRVTLTIVESGAQPDEPFVAIGTCSIEGLPPDLPAESKIEVTITYDAEARISVSAKELTGGKAARVDLQRDGSVTKREVAVDDSASLLTLDQPAESSPSPNRTVSRPATGSPPGIPPIPLSKPVAKPSSPSAIPLATEPGPKKQPVPIPPPAPRTPAPMIAEEAIMLCTKCAERLDVRGECPRCGPRPKQKPVVQGQTKPVATPVAATVPLAGTSGPRPTPPAPAKPTTKPVPPRVAPVPPAAQGPAATGNRKPAPPTPSEDGEEEFWKYVEQ